VYFYGPLLTFLVKNHLQMVYQGIAGCSSQSMNVELTGMLIIFIAAVRLTDVI